jgi:tyrosine decarboxylase/aspartate 1-decarboxylase
VVWKATAETPEQASELAQKIFAACALRDLHLALVKLPLRWFQPAEVSEPANGAGLVTCLRSVLMKPEHEAWLDAIWERLTAACADVLGEEKCL